MIDKKQLKIGNIVYAAIDENENPFPCEIFELERGCIVWGDVGASSGGNSTSYKCVDPIELSPEWLERMGFERLYKDRWNYQKGNVDIEKYGEKGYVLLVEEMSSYNRYYNYVHEVQNLISILTEEELTIKNP